MIRWLAGAALVIPVIGSAQTTNQNGERAFQRCYSCHSVNSGDKGLSGPNLNRIIDGPVASDPEFEYSKAFKDFARKNRRWTRAMLDRFLTDPEAVVPGNQMGFFGLNDRKERQAIIRYITSNK